MNEIEKYFNRDELATSVWTSKYKYKDEIIPDAMHMRMAKEIFRVDSKYQENEVKDERFSKYYNSRENLTDISIFELFRNFRYLVPQGSVMFGLGTDIISSLSNCFVIGSSEDSYGGIFKNDEEQAQLMKRRGGVGHDLSRIRPNGSETKNSAKTSTGVKSFAKRFSNTTREVGQDGRRGALMLSLRVEHPDIMEFINSKTNLTDITGANISVSITNEFMYTVFEDKDFLLRFPIGSYIDDIDMDSLEYNKLTRIDNIYVRKVKSSDLWNAIIKSAHKSAEPGILFIDTHWDRSPDSVYYDYRGVTTNPCGEIFMSPYDACRLLAINFMGIVDNPFTIDAEINFTRLYNISYEAMRISDNIVDLEAEHIDKIIAKVMSDPEPFDVKEREIALWHKIKEKALSSRRVGNGFTALGDMFAALNVKYDSESAMILLKEVMRTKMEAELDCTIDMAINRGSFKNYNTLSEYNILPGVPISGKNMFFEDIIWSFPDQVKRMMEYGRRNVSWSTVAPTGSVSILTQTTSGIEPLFMPYYTRRKKINDEFSRVDFVDNNGDKWQEYFILHPQFIKWVFLNRGKMSMYTIDQCKSWLEDMDKESLDDLFKQSPWYKSTADDISWEGRLKIQSIVQYYTTHSISSTINLPEDISDTMIHDIYKKAFELGLKGITVYRKGSRDGVLVDREEFKDNHSLKRPKTLNAVVVRFNNNKEKWVALIGLVGGKPYEIFTGKLDELNIPQSIDKGKITKYYDEDSKRYSFEYDGGSVHNIAIIFNPDFYNYAKLVSGTLRHGMPLVKVIELISNLSFPEDHINTWRMGVIRSLKKFMKFETAKGMKCDNCGSTEIIFEEGCMVCKSCGSSKCS